jgi:hypothetical protein
MLLPYTKHINMLIVINLHNEWMIFQALNHTLISRFQGLNLRFKAYKPLVIRLFPDNNQQ